MTQNGSVPISVYRNKIFIIKGQEENQRGVRGWKKVEINGRIAGIRV